MHTFFGILFGFLVASAATASAIPDTVEFLMHQPGETCSERWLLRNNAEPDAFNSLGDPLYRFVLASLTCQPGREIVIEELRFYGGEGGGLLFDPSGAGDFFGPVLFDRIGDDIQFLLGSFGLQTEFDPPGRYSLILEIRPAPEPATWLLMIGGLGAAAWLRRRRESRGWRSAALVPVRIA